MATVIRPPLVQKYPARVNPQFYTASVNLLLRNQDLQFGAAGQGKSYDYPNPQRFPDRVSNRTWLNTLSLLLLNQDVQFGAAGQGKSYDYPNPLIPLLRARGYIQQASLVLAVQPAPFAQFNWPNPRIVDNTALRRRVYLFPLTLATIAPFAQLDWPNPRTAPLPARGDTQGTNLSLNAVQAAPFFPIAWPNPALRADRYINRTWTRFSNISAYPLVFSTVTPGQGWPNPKLRTYLAANQGFTSFLATPTIVTLSTAVVTCGCSPYGDGSTYGDGELYCDSDFTRKQYLIRNDTLFHTLAFRLSHTGRFVLDGIHPFVMTRATQPLNYQVDSDQLFHHLSVRIQASGCFKLQSMYPLINTRATRPYIYQVECDQPKVKSLSIRLQATGCMKLTRLGPIIKTKKQQPIA